VSHYMTTIRAAFEAGVATGQKDTAEFERVCHEHANLRELLASVQRSYDAENGAAATMLRMSGAYSPSQDDAGDYARRRDDRFAASRADLPSTLTMLAALALRLGFAGLAMRWHAGR
jgi:hypothetical protein